MVYEAKLHNPSHSTFEALAVQHAVGTVMESWTLPLTKTGCRHLQHVINLLSILLRCNGFTRIQKAVVDQTGSRLPNSDHDLLLVQIWLWEVLWSFFLVLPLSWSLLVVT